MESYYPPEFYFLCLLISFFVCLETRLVVLAFFKLLEYVACVSTSTYIGLGESPEYYDCLIMDPLRVCTLFSKTGKEGCMKCAALLSKEKLFIGEAFVLAVLQMSNKVV